MRRQAAVFVLLVLAVALWFGRAALPGHLPADHTQVMDTYHLSVICERFGHYLSRGEFAAWLPEFGGGYPGHALWLYGFASPAVALWALLPIELAYSWSCILHIAFGGAGLCALLRSRGCGWSGAVTGAVVFALSEYTIGRAAVGHANQLWALAWAPWVLRAVVHAVEARRGAVGLLGIWSGLGLLAGHVQIWFYVGPAAALYAVYLAGNAAGTRRALGRVAAGASLGLAIAAVQLLPALELMRLSDRPEPPRELLELWSAPIHVLAAKVAPGLFGHRPADYWGGQPFEHEHSGLAGAAALVLALLGVLRRDRERWLFGALALAGLVFALGEHTLPTRWIGRLPVIGWGRVAARTQVLTLLFGAGLTGFAVSDWIAGKTDRGALARAGVAALVVFAGALVALRFSDAWNEMPAAVLSSTVLPAVLLSLVGAGAVIGALLLARHRPGWSACVPAAVLLAAVLVLPPVDAVETDFLHVDWAARVPAEARGHRVHLADYRLPHVERQGLRTFRRMAHVDTRWNAALVSNGSPALNRWFDIGAVLGHPARPRGPPSELPSTLWVQPAEQPPVRAAFVRPVVRDAEDEDVEVRLAGGETALFLHGPSSEGHSAAPGEVREAATERSDEVRFEVRAPEGGWLFVSERHYPGWVAEVEGSETELRRANVAFRAVLVPPGPDVWRRVSLRYRSTSLRWGFALTVVALLVSSWIGSGTLRRRGGAE